MNRRLCWGVMGAGQIARVFCNAMRFSKTSKLIAIASSNRHRARALGRFTGLSPRCDQNYEEILQSDDIDAVYIALLNHQHIRGRRCICTVLLFIYLSS